MGTSKLPYNTVEDFFWKSKDMWGPLDLIGKGLLDVFDHPDAVYLKDLRVIEDKGRVKIFMVVHNASEYEYESEVIESYFFSYDKEDVTDYLQCQDINYENLYDYEREDIEDYLRGTALMSSYKDQFYNSKTIIGGYVG